MTSDYCNTALCTIWTFHPFGDSGDDSASSSSSSGPDSVITFESLLFLQNEYLLAAAEQAAGGGGGGGGGAASSAASSAAGCLGSWLSHSGRPCRLKDADAAAPTAAVARFGDIRADAVAKGGAKKSFRGAPPTKAEQLQAGRQESMNLKKKKPAGGAEGGAAAQNGAARGRRGGTDIQVGVGGGLSARDQLYDVIDEATMQASNARLPTFHVSMLSGQDTRDAMDLDLVPEEQVVQLIHARNSIAKLRLYQEVS
jgi:hypothetical protein